MDIGAAFNRSTKDIVKSLVLWIGMMIPIVNIWGFGYYLDCVRATKKKIFPDYDIGSQIVTGIMALIITFVYALIAIIIFVVITVIGGIIDSVLGGTTIIMMLFSLIAVVIVIIIGLMCSAAVMRYAVRRQFGAAFSIGAVAKRAFTVSYIITVILGILNIIPIIGPMITATLFGQLDY